MSTRQPTDPAVAPIGARNVVFISHANPEDNAITTWFGARLAAAGYCVWTDLTRLLGGEEMWSDIDEALRNNVRKVVVLLSSAVRDPRKEGFRAEIHRAEAIRKRLSDKRFLIPVRVDTIGHEDLPITLGNRTVIDASKSLASGLRDLFRVLEEDNVPHSQPPTETLSHWQTIITGRVPESELHAESLITNWFPIISFPRHLNIYSIECPLSNPLGEASKIASEHQLPMAAHFRRLVSFAEFHEVQEPLTETVPVKLEQSLRLDEFLAGGSGNFAIEPREARKLLMNLLRQGFDCFARARGLKPYRLSEAKTAWWVPCEEAEFPKHTFVRSSGVPGWRQLGGNFSARKRNWHFGVNAVPMLDSYPRFRMVGHVIFVDPTGKKEATAEYRRSMCKFWFNAKWRDLLFAMMQSVLSPQATFAIPFGHNAFAEVSAKPLDFVHPIRLSIAADVNASTRKAIDGDIVDIDPSEREGDPILAGEPEEEAIETDEEE